MVNKNRHDISQIFLVYMALVGDAEKTALALDLDSRLVEELATKEGWVEKVRRISILSKSGTPGDWERAQNRALNFVQCHQLRKTIDSAMAHLSELPVEEVLSFEDSNGHYKLSGRVLLDLSHAMRQVHDMTYAALGDSVKERVERAAESGEDPAAQVGLHQALISALNAAKTPQSDSQALVEATTDKVIEVVSVPPPSSV